MNYRELWKNENAKIAERYNLAMERLSKIPGETRVEPGYAAYFVH